MKVKKFNEEIKTVKLSDMDDWSGKKKIIYSGSKNIDLQLGSKVIDLLAEYGLGIVSILPGKWIHDQKLLLPDETDFQEYRVTLGTKQDWDDFIEEYNEEIDSTYDDLSDEEQEKVDEIYDNLPYVSDTYTSDIEFSVFLPSNIQQIDESAMSDASSYLKLLNNSNLKDVIAGHCEYQVFYYDTKGVINFINNKNIVITNKNLELVNTISYRLYKDSKVFSVIEDTIGENKTKRLINDWLKLIK